MATIKKEQIIVRMNAKLKKQIEDKAALENLTVSDYIRNLIEKDLLGNSKNQRRIYLETLKELIELKEEEVKYETDGNIQLDVLLKIKEKEDLLSKLIKHGDI